MVAADVLREWWQMLSRRIPDLDRFGSYDPDLVRPGFYTGELDALCWKVRELEKQVEALQEQVLDLSRHGCRVSLTVGIDLGGTSREALDELLTWGCDVFVVHNPMPRSTFHPKVSLIETPCRATLFVGSANLTDGGWFSNEELTVRMEFELPAEAQLFREVIEPFGALLTPAVAPTVRRLTFELIAVLTARGMVPTEAEARARRRENLGATPRDFAGLPPNPFEATDVPQAPLLPRGERAREPHRRGAGVTVETNPRPIPTRGERMLVWRKTLSRSDAQDVGAGTNPVGGVRLTQARFERTPGHRIDQTTYFRQLFSDLRWIHEERGHQDQEHALVPIRVVIRGTDYGTRLLELSHKPSGEAGQANYTTILRWGHELMPIVVREQLAGMELRLFETTDDNAPFLLEIS